MSENKGIGTSAKELVLIFYEKTGLKCTNTDIARSVKNAKDLLKAGYTYDEIKETIEYCVANQPEKGIYSFGFIVNQINKVLAMINAKKKKDENTKEALSINNFSTYGLEKVSNKDKMKERNTKIDIDIFK